MRYARVVMGVLALALAGCQGSLGSTKPYVVGPDPIPGQGFRFVGHVNGDFDGQGFSYAVPVTALVKGHGEMTVTARAFPPPFLVIDGNANVIVEPIAPGKEIEAIQAVQRGEILIRRNGVPGALNPVGSIAGYKTALIRAYEARKAAQPAQPAPAPAAESFPPPPPPPAEPAPVEPPAAEQPAAGATGFVPCVPCVPVPCCGDGGPCEIPSPCAAPAAFVVRRP